MNILVLGGTRFQGPYLVRELLDAGHGVTIFHKGNHAIEPCSGLTDLIGDRNVAEDLAPLAGHHFDTCIDTCAYFPSQIALVNDILTIQHYCLVSTVHVYADQDDLLNEDSPLF